MASWQGNERVLKYRSITFTTDFCNLSLRVRLTQVAFFLLAHRSTLKAEIATTDIYQSEFERVGFRPNHTKNRRLGGENVQAIKISAFQANNY